MKNLIVNGKNLGPYLGSPRKSNSMDALVFLMEAGYYITIERFSMKSFIEEEDGCGVEIYG